MNRVLSKLAFTVALAPALALVLSIGRGLREPTHPPRPRRLRRRPRRAPRRVRPASATRRRSALTDLPGRSAAAPRGGQAAGGCRFHSKVEDIKKGTKQIGVGTADVSMLAGIRDQRQSALKQRVLALLITEIQQLESLYKSTELRSKDRPMLLRRMAEDYVELENAAFREKTEAEIKRDNFKKTNPREAGKQQAIANSRKTTMDRSRKAAIAYYTLLVERLLGQPVQPVPEQPAAGVPVARRGLLLPRVRVRAVG